MVTLLGKQGILFRAVCEIRYDRGFRYLDRCGEILNRLLPPAGHWVAGQVDPQNAPLASPKTGASVTIGPRNYAITWEQRADGPVLQGERLKELLEEADQTWDAAKLIVEQEAITRIGVRVVYHFPCADASEAERFLEELGMIRVNPAFLHQLTAELRASEFVLLAHTEDFDLRIGAEHRTLRVGTGPEPYVHAERRGNDAEGRFAKMRRGVDGWVQYAVPSFVAAFDLDVSCSSFCGTSLADHVRRGLGVAESVMAKLPIGWGT